MAGSDIFIYQGRAKAFILQWKQGGLGGPPINATGATFAIMRTTLPCAPIITILDESIGRYKVTFQALCTAGLKPGAIKSVTFALTLPGAAEAESPDPVTAQVVIK